MDVGRKSAEEYFRNSEGIQVHEGNVYFMSKKEHKMFILYQNMTWTSEESGVKFYGEGSFDGQPDQHLFGPSRKYIYFTEDGSEDPGVYARFGDDETYFTMFQAIAGGIHTDDWRIPFDWQAQKKACEPCRRLPTIEVSIRSPKGELH